MNMSADIASITFMRKFEDEDEGGEGEEEGEDVEAMIPMI